MKYLIVALVPLAIFIVGYVLGRASGKRLAVGDRQKLKNLTALRSNLFALSAQHGALGDSFALVVTDEIQQNILKENS